MVDKYKIEPSSCLYIGDSEEYDIEGAKNAGLFAVRICHGNRSRIESTADFVCDGFEELLSFLENDLDVDG
ncbi:HAD hydrolase-like protein [Tissierella sp. MSJ-40]|uniref:HAD hydrolase-like protein n=1 Tax=Tissierella simiarum TaxID=2841534 RepID=A0ABS6E762_9FIRM|nr:HAD hydrolase-like protein [Tissierella simiarum]